MAQNVGTLELKEKPLDGGGVMQVYMGKFNIAGVIAGGLAIAKNPNAQPGAVMDHVVKVRSAGDWAAIGKARFKRKNDKSAHYMEMVLEGPLIDAKIGKELWLRAFPPAGTNTGKAPDASEYDIVYGNGKKQVSPSDISSDEIPF